MFSTRSEGVDTNTSPFAQQPDGSSISLINENILKIFQGSRLDQNAAYELKRNLKATQFSGLDLRKETFDLLVGKLSSREVNVDYYAEQILAAINRSKNWHLPMF